MHNKYVESEKNQVKEMVGDLIISLWYSDICQAHGETLEHEIYVWKEDNCIKAVVRHK